MAQNNRNYDFSYFRQAAFMLTEKTSATNYARRLKYFTNKMAEPNFEQGSNILMDSLYHTLSDEDAVHPDISFTQERQYRALKGMLSFYPLLAENTAVDKQYKSNTMEMLSDFCLNAQDKSDRNPYVASAARSALQNNLFSA